MKKTFIALALAASFTAHADGYVGIFGVADDNTLKGATTQLSTSNIAIAFAVKTPGTTSVGAELSFAGSGSNFAAFLQQDFGKLSFNVGRIQLSTNSTGITANGVAYDNESSYGNFLGISYDIFHVRYIKGDDINYTYQKTVGNLTATSYGSAEVEQLWAGVKVNF